MKVVVLFPDEDNPIEMVAGDKSGFEGDASDIRATIDVQRIPVTTFGGASTVYLPSRRTLVIDIHIEKELTK